MGDVQYLCLVSPYSSLLRVYAVCGQPLLRFSDSGGTGQPYFAARGDKNEKTAIRGEKQSNKYFYNRRHKQHRAHEEDTSNSIGGRLCVHMCVRVGSCVRLDRATTRREHQVSTVSIITPKSQRSMQRPSSRAYESTGSTNPTKQHVVLETSR